MTEDELLEQIRTVDPDAHVIEKDGFRVIVTTSIAAHNVAFVNPANMHIYPFDFDFGVPDDDAVGMKKMWRHKDGTIRVDHMDAAPGDYFGGPDGFD